MNDIEFAIELARSAGDLCLQIREKNLPITNTPPTSTQLGKYADTTIQAWIEKQFKLYKPHDFVLSEEAPDNLARLSQRKVWIIDPLDGSDAYARGSDEFAIHIGWWEQDSPLQGVVNLPAYHKLYVSSQVKKISPLAPLTHILVKSRARNLTLIEELAQTLKLKVQPLSSAGFKAMQLLENRADIYVHEGLMNEWDTCAPVAVAQSAGLYCSDFSGKPLQYNKPVPLTRELLICRSSLTESALSFLRTHPIPN